jgi:hypothetical protein
MSLSIASESIQDIVVHLKASTMLKGDETSAKNSPAPSRPGWYVSGKTGEKIVQEMNVRSGARRIRKGYETVLKERGRWPNGSAKFVGVCKLCKKEKTRGYTDNVDLSRRKCCATRIIVAEPDFVEQRSQIEELIRKRGHLLKGDPHHADSRRCWCGLGATRRGSL